MQALDAALFRLVNDLTGSPAMDDFAVFAARVLILLMAAALIASLFLPSWRRYFGGRIVVARATLACIFGAAGNLVIGLIFFRPRPFITLSRVHLLIPPPLTAQSFPSDHATLAFAMAWSVFASRRNAGGVMLAAAAVVAVGRVLVGVHYPGDVLAGFVVGTFWAWVATKIVRDVGHATTHAKGTQP